MPKSCVSWGCTNHNLKDRNLVFSIFPNKEKQPERWKKWVQAVRRLQPDGSKWEPQSKWVYLCRKHFITGCSNKDPDHPDHVPSIFPHRECSTKLNEKKLERYSNAKKRRETPEPQKKVFMAKTKQEYMSPMPKRRCFEINDNEQLVRNIVADHGIYILKQHQLKLQ